MTDLKSLSVSWRVFWAMWALLPFAYVATKTAPTMKGDAFVPFDIETIAIRAEQADQARGCNRRRSDPFGRPDADPNLRLRPDPDPWIRLAAPTVDPFTRPLTSINRYTSTRPSARA